MADAEQYRIDTTEYGSNDIEAALNAGTALARPILNPHPESTHAVLIPAGFALHYLQREEQPQRCKAAVKMADAESFISFWRQTHTTDSRIYGSMNPLAFSAVFNDHFRDAPGWRDYRCVYAPTFSKEWLVWKKHDRQKFDGNEAFAVWLEDNAIDVLRPDPAKMMDIALNMKVNQVQGFANAIRLGDGTIQLTYTNDVDASSKASGGGKLAIPETFTIEIPVFEGLGAPKYRVDARFRYRLQSGTLSIHYELIRPHKVVELAFTALLKQITDATKQFVLFGSPE